MKKPFTFAVLAYVIPTFITGFVWHLVTFHDAYTRLQIYRADPVIPLGFAAMLLQAFVFAWAYPRLFDTARSAWMGAALRAGISFGALSWSFTTLAVAAKHPMTSLATFFALETAFTALQFSVVAPLMAIAWRGHRVH